jgi:YVTN family beta-propeller protein
LGQTIAITPNGTTAYVANTDDGTVTPIRTATNTAGPPIPVGSGPFDIAITPNGNTAYVLNSAGDTVTPTGMSTTIQKRAFCAPTIGQDTRSMATFLRSMATFLVRRPGLGLLAR